jgi:ubiquinone/menaquinone biosynthesis C-methylase UbiE
MNLNRHKLLFNTIAPGYNWFYKRQVSYYADILSKYITKLEISDDSRILDAGCGTGSLTRAFSDRGFEVTGIDIAENMIHSGIKHGLDCRYGNIIAGLDFEDHSFDLVTFAFVAHGLDRDKRKKLYIEAKRLTRGKVLFHDYSSERKIMTNIIEFIEGGDYFNFILTGLSEMQEVYNTVQVIKINKTTNWYICTP